MPNLNTSATVISSQHPRNSSTVELSEVVGDITRKGEPTTLGQSLCLADAVGGFCSHKFAKRSVVTGCFDSIEVINQPLNGDVVTGFASVVSVGTRSILIQIDLYLDPRTITLSRIPPTHSLRAFATFIVSQGKSLPSTPVTNETDYTKYDLLSKSFKGLRKQLITTPQLSSSFPTSNKNEPTERIVDIRDTHIRTKRYFLPKHMNYADVVFGGEVLKAIELIALSAASKMFECPCEVKSIKAMSFWKEVPKLNPLQIDAVIIGVINGNACISVRSTLEGEETPAHTALVFVKPQKDLDHEKITIIADPVSKENNVLQKEQLDQKLWSDKQYAQELQHFTIASAVFNMESL